MKIDKILSSSLLPSLPQVAVNVLELSNQPDSDVAEIAAVIKHDPAISVSILRAANSSYFGFKSKVLSLDRAVALLGSNVVSSLVLSFSLVDSVTANGPMARHYKSYWQHSMAQAAAAEVIAEYVGEPLSCEPFLAGLLMDIGRLAMLKTLGEVYLPALDHVEKMPDRFLHELETVCFDYDHSVVGSRLLKKWEIDECLIDVAQWHHLPLVGLQSMSAAPHYGLLKITALAAAVTDYLLSKQVALALYRVQSLSSAFLQLENEQVTELIEKIRDRINLAGEVFEIDMSQVGDPQELMLVAKDQLSKVAIEKHSLVNEAAAKKKLQTFEPICLHLSSETESSPYLDTSSGTYNRSFFDEVLNKEIIRCHRENDTIGLVLVSVDNFSRLSMLNADLVADVLQQVGSTINQTTRGSDYAARYSEDKFIVLAIQPTPEGVNFMAERVRRSIEALVFSLDGTRVPVTASVGAVTATGHFAEAEQLKYCLINATDRMLHKSKNNGANQIHAGIINSEMSMPPVSGSV